MEKARYSKKTIRICHHGQEPVRAKPYKQKKRKFAKYQVAKKSIEQKSIGQKINVIKSLSKNILPKNQFANISNCKKKQLTETLIGHYKYWP